MHSRVDPRHGRSTGARRPAYRPHHARWRSTNRVAGSRCPHPRKARYCAGGTPRCAGRPGPATRRRVRSTRALRAPPPVPGSAGSSPLAARDDAVPWRNEMTIPIGLQHDQLGRDLRQKREAHRDRPGLARDFLGSPHRTSGPSRHNFGIYGLELTARIVDLHLPVDTALRAIDVGGPRRHFVVQRPEVAEAALAHALARHRAQFVLRDVQPAPVFRRVAELDATNQLPCPGRLEHFVEGSLGVRVRWSHTKVIFGQSA